MKIKLDKITVSVGIPFFATATFFLAGGMRMNYLCALAFSFLHEAGHLAALLYFGKKPKSITFGVMGIRIEKNGISLSYKEECITALCGPAVNMLCLLIFASCGIDSLPFAANAGLFVINMLPVRSLDGGRFIYNFLLQKYDGITSQKIMNLTEIATVAVLIMLLAFSLITGYVNASFVLFSVLLVIMTVSEILLKR